MNYLQNNEWSAIADEVSFTLNLDWDAFVQYIPKDSSVFDYGCGYGRNLIELSDLAYTKLRGCDSCSRMIGRALASHPYLDIYTSKGIRTDEEDEAFDCVVLCAILTCLPQADDRALVIDEALRILKPDGILYICEFARSDFQDYQEDGCFDSRIGVRMKHFTTPEISNLVSNLKKIRLDVLPACTIGGMEINSIHFIGKKDASHSASGKSAPPGA